MTSPAKAHFQRTTAALEAAKASAGSPMQGATGYELMLAQLDGHKRRLKQVQSIARKVEIKRELLVEYDPYVEGVLSGGRGAQDDVLMTVMVWRIDTGDTAGALAIARYAIAHGLTMPDQYSRTTATLIAEEFAGAAFSARGDGEAIDAPLLLDVLALVDEQDMPDEVKAKLHKAIAYALEPDNKPEALNHLQQALRLHDRVGVKDDIKRIERDIKNTSV
ncbi:Phage small terminase subunit [Andreprevotia lacus DSM 23236]|jgi:hypothetical protein|uniref:Phage small terminase subunit n=1 Tax=Andreprevotia lacus DSM 23236 TaxID=1121001 RepID=A0A1W1XK47_9NEIS|nr:terminase endonuclease subunit [Andreprevotia lacus]SMC24167.1 Phage small terminase subunit [Andreprevotia lacus DSM 23236]